MSGRIRHNDPDLIRRSIAEDRAAAEARLDLLWLVDERAADYHAATERAERCAEQDGIPLSTALRDEINRIRLGWDPPSGAGALCRLEDRNRHRERTYRQ
jgi:hypothetical protein